MMTATRNGNLGGEGEAKEPTRSCPICGKPTAFATRPFCSNRCADVDLYRWLGGAYAIPADDETQPAELGADSQHAAKLPET
jgi:endogenous inhibitor of DNA gyrase (YacG/DUF329 family)